MRKLTLGLLAMGISFSAHAQSTNWRYQKTQDAFTDVQRSYAETQLGGHSLLAVMCQSDVVTVVTKTDYLDIEFGDVRQVTWRIDEHESVSQSWRNMPKGGALIIGEEAAHLAGMLRDASSRFAIRSGPAVRQFGVKGSTSAISKVLADCGRQ